MLAFPTAIFSSKSNVFENNVLPETMFQNHDFGKPFKKTFPMVLFFSESVSSVLISGRKYDFKYDFLAHAF
jgi:hypothetical protein